MRSSFKLVFALLLSGLSFPSQALFYELSGNMTYDKTVYGTNRQNNVTNRYYGGSVAVYVFSSTAIEVNYAYDRDTNTQNETVPFNSTFEVLSQKDTTERTIYGIGLRQRFAPKGAWLTPLISLGYAKEFRQGERSFLTNNPTTGQEETITIKDNRKRIDSVFAKFILQLKLTKFISLNGSVETVFKAFEYNEAKDYIKYTAGFSWLF